MRVGKHLIVAIFSFLLYWVVPNGTHWGLMVMCFVLFLLISYDLLKDDFINRDYISFNSIFLTSFFLTTFAFPVFILSSDSLLSQFTDLSMVVFQYVDFNYLARGVFLSLMAISIYAAVYLKNYKTVLVEKSSQHNRELSKKNIDMFLLIILMVTIFNAFYSLNTYAVTNLQQNAYVYDLLKASLVISFLARIHDISKRPQSSDRFILFIKNNLYPIIIAIIATLLFLYFGVRNLAISVVLIVVTVMVVYYTKISFKYVLVLLVIGTLSLFVIRETRHSDSSIMNSNLATTVAAANVKQTPALLLFSDLIGACQELSLGIEIKDKTGLQNPEQVVLLPFLPFPVLPSLVSNLLWDKSYQEATAAFILNDYMLATSNKQASYGKHCVSDLYMKWGVLGVILFFAFLGKIIATQNANKHNNYFSAAIIICLTSLSLFLARGSLIDLIRPMSYVYFMILLFSKKKSIIKLEMQE